MRTVKDRVSRLAASAVVAAGVALPLAFTTAAGAANASVNIFENSNGCSPSYCFTPQTVTAGPGDSVTWANHTDAAHTITRCTASACAGNGPGTGTDAGLGGTTTASSGTYSFTFHGAGTYVYYCTIHGYAVMHGTVTVASPPASSPTPSPSSGGGVTTPATGADLPPVGVGAVVAGIALVLAGAGIGGIPQRRRARRRR